jgi:hypothetical protein
MSSTAFPVVKGYKLRATKINSCGMPVAGAANRLVTSGFISVALTMVQQPAQDLEQSNAEGQICVSDRTPPQRKWYTPAIELCNVDPGLIGLMSGWPQYLDYNDNTIGYKDATNVDEDYGVALEIWTGGKGADDCPTPTTDSIFSTATSGLQYGYFLFGGVEWVMGNITIAAQVATFTLTGRTIPMPQWGCGPYNVQAINAGGTPGRLLVPCGQDEHYTAFRTPVAPPDATDGAVPLAISSLFNNYLSPPVFYYGGPSGAPPAAIAPEQPMVNTFIISITGNPTSGFFTLLLNGEETGELQYNCADTDVDNAFLAMDPQNFITPDWGYAASGGPFPSSSITVGFPFDATLQVGQNQLEGGTNPQISITSTTNASPGPSQG